VAAARPPASRGGKGDAYEYCKRCHPGAIAQEWTREQVRVAIRAWQKRYGTPPSSYDWSGTHASRRGPEALARLQDGAWPAASTVSDLCGSWAAARADAPTRSPTPERGGARRSALGRGSQTRPQPRGRPRRRHGFPTLWPGISGQRVRICREAFQALIDHGYRDPSTAASGVRRASVLGWRRDSLPNSSRVPDAYHPPLRTSVTAGRQSHIRGAQTSSIADPAGTAPVARRPGSEGTALWVQGSRIAVIEQVLPGHPTERCQGVDGARIGAGVLHGRSP
jgi:hypothetical protein